MPEPESRQIEYTVKDESELMRLKQAMSRLEKEISILPDDVSLLVTNVSLEGLEVKVAPSFVGGNIEGVETHGKTKLSLKAEANGVDIRIGSTNYRISYDH